MFSSSKFLLPACAAWTIGTSFAGEKVSTADAQSLIKAYENARLEFRPGAESKPSAYNKKQNWVTQLDQQGFIVNPRGRDWTWGLGLKSWGPAGAEQTVSTQTLNGYQTQGNRVTYGHSGQLEEWFLNDQRGLEHGFTVKEKPAGDAKALDFRMSVRGSLKAKLDGDHVEFVDASGAERLTYSGLKAWDANGKALAANFKVDQNDLVISVDSANAAYPITVDPLAEDPLAQTAYLKPEATTTGDFFGYSVAIDGDLAVVGVPYDDSSGKGVDPSNADSTLGQDSGAIYVFIRTSGSWAVDGYIKPSVNTAQDYFGCSVDISGDTIVVGAYGGDTSPYNMSGAAYVYTYNSTLKTWVEKSILKASTPYAAAYFGYSVAIKDDLLVVGAPGESSKSKVVGGDETDHSAANAGAAYVFQRITSGGRTGTWAQKAYLKPSLNAAANQFGYSVGISSDSVIVGAPFESSAGSGIDPSTSSKKSASSGAAFIFTYLNSAWQQAAAIKSSNPTAGDSFGFSVAIDDNIAVVGSPKESSNSTSINGTRNDGTKGSGAVYVYSRESQNWTEEAFLKPFNTGSNDLFGYSVQVDGDKIIVGAPLEDGSGKGINQATNESKKDSGAAYLFVKNNGVWYQDSYIKASNTDAGDYFGVAVDVSDTTVLVGARAEDSASTTIGGAQTNSPTNITTWNYGAAYVFEGVSTAVAPQIYLTGEDTQIIANGSTEDFGLLASKKSLKKTYTVKNTGTAAMNYTVTLNKDTSAPFSLGGTKGKTLLPGQSEDFNITFAPKAAGDFTGSIVISSNDPADELRTFALEGSCYVPTPEIQVFGPDTSELTDGANTITWPVTAINTSSSYTFTLKNAGTGDLTGVSVSVTGTGAKAFKVSAKPSSKILVGGQTTFTVTFTSKVDGTFPAALQIKSNDADEKVFDVNITASTTSAP